MTICKLCGHTFRDYEYRNRTRCGSCDTKIRRFRTKAAAIKLLGGKCVKCGWHGDQATMQFHHKNPIKKDFIIGNAANKSWDYIKKEVEKCVLLCANCHLIEHSTKKQEKFLQEVYNYKGRKLEF